MISNVNKVFILCGFLSFLTSFYTSDIYADASMMELQFESIFPASEYKDVYVTCVDMWQDLRTCEEKKLTEQDWNTFHEKLINDLMQLKVTIECMLAHPRNCSPDDLEYLMEILYLIHCEYVHMTNYKVNEMTICISVLFDHMQKLLSKPFEPIKNSN